ncbi:MAG: PAS domain-containing sensor histidine kinase, partial [Acidiferrobacterales bacterium]
TPIQLSAERIRHKCMDSLDDSEQRTLDRATHTIAEQVEALKSMVNAFSDYARPVQMKIEPMNLNALIRDVVELYGTEVLEGADSRTSKRRPRSTAKRRTARSRRLRVELDLDPALPRFTADAGRLRQVLHNLLLNARDALVAQPEPLIHIATRQVGAERDTSIQLTMEDNGPGFPDSIMDNLFEPYVTTSEKGTGLGLAIVKKIVEEHNGTLYAANSEGGGARVQIKLPVGADVSTKTRAAVLRAPAPREKRA